MILTPELKEVGRRNFLKASAALPAAGAYALSRSNFGPVKAGIIGTGGEGRVLMENCPVDYVQIVAACDIRPDHLQMARDIGTKKWGIELNTYTEYKEMLANEDIEAVIIASPLWQHAPMTIDCLNAGKHVLCEKTMAKTVADCQAMIAAAEKSGKNLQIGHQRFYNPIYWQMYQMVMGGELGDIYHIRCQWHRNGNWVRPRWWENESHLETYPAMKDFDPKPWGYDQRDHLNNWRLYEKQSEGLMTESASHMIAVTNWLADKKDPELVKDMKPEDITVEGVPPKSVCASGGIYRYKDERQIEDHTYATFTYPSNMTVTFSSIQSNAYDNYYEMIMGTKGTMVLRSEVETYLFWEPVWLREKERLEKEAKGTEVASEKAEAASAAGAASASRGADVAGEQIGAGAAGGGGMDWKYAYTNEIRGFAETIRVGRNNLCSGQAGLYAAQAVLGANYAMRHNCQVEFDAQGNPVPSKPTQEAVV